MATIIENIKKSAEGVQSLKTQLADALRSKGVNPADKQLKDYPALVRSIRTEAGGATDFFRCAEVGRGTWSGYKAVLVAEDGKNYWKIEETLTEGLTWGKGFTPQVGRIYDAEATIAAVLSEPDPGLSAPNNMTTYENDEWIVSANSEFNGTMAWEAFDGNPDSIWATSYGSSELTWRNKIRTVLVRQLEIVYDANAHKNDSTYDVTLYGSNNGEDWTEIGSLTYLDYVRDENGYATATVTYPENKTSYFYHKIRGNTKASVRNVIGTLTAKPKIDGEYDG